MRRPLCLSIIAAALLAVAIPALSGRAAIIHVTTDVTNNVNSIEENQTLTLNVRALVENALSPNDGIFTFDLDLILTNVLLNQPSVLAVQSITRPGVNDGLFGGSDGTAMPSGLNGIYGGYLQDTRGIGSAALLFSVVLKGVGIGSDDITPGPSTDPLGFDFVLYQSALTDTSVTYDSGAMIQVVAPGNGGNGGGGNGGGGGNQVPLPPAFFSAGIAILCIRLVAPRLKACAQR